VSENRRINEHVTKNNKIMNLLNEILED